jgi:predicted RNA-binding Zn ribbon-like protein
MPPVIPPHATVLRDFANTLDVDEGTDALSRPAQLADWLLERELLDRRTGTPADDDLALACELRDAVRAAFRANHDDADAADTGPNEALEHVGERLPLALQVCGGRPRLEPLEGGVRGALTLLLVAAADAGADGSWRRLKICAADDCAWAFYDTSKNRSKIWCSMQVCGNRAKTRSYRARHTTDG